MSKQDNFIITGYGRSGTKYLSQVLSTSKQWDIHHEPRLDADERYKDDNYSYNILQPIFDKNNMYGEVNSYLRFHYKRLKPAICGIILRKPTDIYLSVCNRKPVNKHVNYIHDIAKAYKWFIDDYGRHDIFFIKFDEYIGNKDNVVQLANYLNITDIDINHVTEKKVNKNKQIKFLNINKLPSTSRDGIQILYELDEWYEQTKSYFIKR